MLCLQREHQLAEENNTALMEDRVNLIAQLTQTKIEVRVLLEQTLLYILLTLCVVSVSRSA